MFDVNPSRTAPLWHGDGGGRDSAAANDAAAAAGGGGGVVGATRSARLVVIGRRLNRASLEAGFGACFVGSTRGEGA